MALAVAACSATASPSPTGTPAFPTGTPSARAPITLEPSGNPLPGPTLYQDVCALEESTCSSVDAPPGSLPAALVRPLGLPTVAPRQMCPASPGAVVAGTNLGGLGLGIGKPIRPIGPFSALGAHEWRRCWQRQPRCEVLRCAIQETAPVGGEAGRPSGVIGGPWCHRRYDGRPGPQGAIQRHGAGPAGCGHAPYMRCAAPAAPLTTSGIVAARGRSEARAGAGDRGASRARTTPRQSSPAACTRRSAVNAAPSGHCRTVPPTQLCAPLPDTVCRDAAATAYRTLSHRSAALGVRSD